jgi:hypothetical protein
MKKHEKRHISHLVFQNKFFPKSTLFEQLCGYFQIKAFFPMHMQLTLFWHRILNLKIFHFFQKSGNFSSRNHLLMRFHFKIGFLRSFTKNAF